MQSKNPSDELPASPRREWHAPQCRRKTWLTPKLTSIEFNETKGGILSHKTENSSGTLSS